MGCGKTDCMFLAMHLYDSGHGDSGCIGGAGWRWTTLLRSYSFMIRLRFKSNFICERFIPACRRSGYIAPASRELGLL